MTVARSVFEFPDVFLAIGGRKGALAVEHVVFVFPDDFLAIRERIDAPAIVLANCDVPRASWEIALPGS